MASYSPNDEWLEQFACKVRALLKIPNHTDVVKRLAQPSEYMGALFELDAALALSVSQFEVTFVRKGAIPSIDMLALKDSTCAVEVTSLNSSRAFERMDRIASHASFQTFKMKENLVSGGVVIQAPNREADLIEVFQEIDVTIARAIESGYERMNIPGTATLYFAKAESIDKIPQDCRNQFRFGKLVERDIQDRIMQDK